MPRLRTPSTWLIATAIAALFSAAVAGATPLASTRDDFHLPGTQPLTITDNIPTPDQCTSCHANYGQPNVEPFRAWKGSMMAQAGRDPLMYAALAISNQMVPESGETCLRCHLPKGWLEGRSFQADGALMNADDRQGVQCGVCHRLVDPVAAGENPAVDTPILTALAEPVPAFGGAMMVVDPLNRLRGPFDVVADLGSDPHTGAFSTLVSPFHSSADLCGTCHNLRNPLFAKNTMTGEWELHPLDLANPDPATGFPEQSTFDEWKASAYAAGGVAAPQFGGNKVVVETCQDCHMPDVSGKDANLGRTRTDVPHHTFAGANTFIPAVLPHHPAFGAEVDAAALNQGIVSSTDMLRKAATVSGTLGGGNLTVRVSNESGHKLPTGYPEGRRMWLHVRALDDDRNVVFESGRYIFSSATLSGYGAAPLDLDYDANLQVWEAEQGISPALAAQVGLPAGRSFHLSLNNVRLKDNRIPPRGFSNAAFAAVDAEPVGASYADGEHWDDVVYPVGTAATRAEVTLYYQTASREYVEFLRDENTTTASGAILFDLWNDHDKSTPVEMARLTVETDVKTVNKCRDRVAKGQSKYLKRYLKAWSRCFDSATGGTSCDSASRDAAIAAAAAELRGRLGGTKDKACAGAGLTPSSLGHGSTCPAPCNGLRLFDVADLATCSICLADAVGDAGLNAAYGSTPPAIPAAVPSPVLSCLKRLGKTTGKLASKWSDALTRCDRDNASGKNAPPAVCASDPDGRIAQAQAQAEASVAHCTSFTGIDGCASAGAAAAVSACIEADLGTVVGPFSEGGYP